MDPELFKTLGKIAGLAGLGIGLLLIIFREIIRKNVFPRLKQRDAYRLLLNIALLVWSVAVLGILVWAYHGSRSNGSAERNTAGSRGPLVIAGTVVDRATNAGIGQAKIVISGQTAVYLSEDTGNFQITLPPSTPRSERVRIAVSKSGYLPLDRSVEPPTQDLILPMQRE